MEERGSRELREGNRDRERGPEGERETKKQMKEEWLNREGASRRLREREKGRKRDRGERRVMGEVGGREGVRLMAF